MKQMHHDQLSEYFSNNEFALLIGVGFDARYPVAYSHLSKVSLGAIYGMPNISYEKFYSHSPRSEFENLTRGKGIWIGDNCHTALESVDALIDGFVPLREPGTDIVIDISSMSHELLIVIVGLLSKYKAIDRTTLLYTSATEYGQNQQRTKYWLSNGVSEIRSVLGFPGKMLPSKKLHLIVMAGFELERAAEVISQYEPSKLSIGYGDKEGSISEALHLENQETATRLELFISEQDQFVGSEIDSIRFSCTDAFATSAVILAHAAKYPDCNTVVCPLNTKIAAVGAALAGLRNPSIQICYPEPNEYNIHGYALPGDCVTIIPLGEKGDNA